MWDNNQWKRNNPERDLTGLLYISESVDTPTEPNQFSGGHLLLDNLIMDNSPVRIRPTKGQLIMFPSHPMFVHQVEPITAGYRISFVNWYSVR